MYIHMTLTDKRVIISPLKRSTSLHSHGVNYPRRPKALGLVRTMAMKVR